MYYSVVCTTAVGRFHLAEAGLSKQQVGHMLGNAMSVNVLGRILPRALHAAGLIEKLPRDPWASHCSK